MRWICSRHQLGASFIEYVLITAMTASSLLLPWGSDHLSVMQRLLLALKQDHAGYLYVAGMPSLPGDEVTGSGSAVPSDGGQAPQGPEQSGNPSAPGSTTPLGAHVPGPAGGPGAAPVGIGGGGAGTVPPAPTPTPGTDGGAGTPDAGPLAGMVPETGVPGESLIRPIVSSPAWGGLAPAPGQGVPGHSLLPEMADGPALGAPLYCQAGAAPALTGASQPTGVMATHVGNPVHVLTGNKYQQEVDFQGSPNGPAFLRHYNSRSHRRGVLGVGWRHNYEVDLHDRGDRVQLWQADGRRIDFVLADPPAKGVRRFQAAQHKDGEITAGPFGYQWRWNNGTTLDFNPDRQLIALRPISGSTLRLNWNARGQLVSVLDAQAQGFELRYSKQGNLQSLTDSTGRRIHYRVDAQHNLREVNEPKTRKRRYRYQDANDPHNLSSILAVTDGEERTLAEWKYDKQDRAIAAKNEQSGIQISLDYKADETWVTDAQGGISQYGREQIDQVPVVSFIRGPGCSPCGGGDVKYTYNQRLQLSRLMGSNGQVIEYEHDALGRLVLARTDAGQAGMEPFAGFSYLDDTELVTQVRVPSVKPGGWQRFDFDYDPSNRLVRAAQHGFSPNALGGFDPISRTQHFGYENGRLARVDGPLEGAEDVLRILRKGPQHTTWFPDGGRLSVLATDDAGRAVRVETERAVPIELHYADNGSLEAVSRGEARIELGAVLPAALIEDRTSAGSVEQLLSDQARSFLYAGRQLRQRQIWMDDAGHETTFLFDDFGRVVLEQSPDRGTRSQAYNGFDQRVRHVDANGNEATMTHYRTGALRTIKVGALSTRFDWQGGGTGRRLMATVSADGSAEFDYDTGGKRVRQSVKLGHRHYTIGYRYDSSGRLLTKTLPDGRELRFQYSPQGQLQRIEELAGLGRSFPILSGMNDETSAQRARGIATWTLLNGPETFARFSNGKLSGLAVSGSHDFAYRYTAGRITGIDNHGVPFKRFRYDDRGRLDFAITPESLYGYAYGPNGNRRSRSINGQSENYEVSATSNRLVSASSLLSRWHAPLKPRQINLRARNQSREPKGLIDSLPGGEISRLRDLEIDYNANGQPKKIYRLGQLIAQYRYNHRAERIEKIVYARSDKRGQEGSISSANRYLYENGRLIAEIDQTGRIQRQYLYLGHHPIAILDADARYAVHSNHLGAPILVTNETGMPIWRAQYAPFGEARVDSDPDGDGVQFEMNLRLPGQYFDRETGLHYNLHRYYDPSMGRYISPDPLGIAAGPNPYVYAGNDPINFIDPTGLLLFAFDGTGNNDPPEEKSDFSNVVKFRDSYLPDSFELANWRGEHHFYISGAGTWDQYYGIRSGGTDAATGQSMPTRVRMLWTEFENYLGSFERKAIDDHKLNIDVVGFSRGAASARMFVNLMDAFLSGKSSFQLVRESGPNNDRVTFSQRALNARAYVNANCIDLAIRFLGLWDTVPHFGVDQDNDLQQIPLGIPKRVIRAAHAIAVNENRKDFHGVSIHASRLTPTSALSGGGLNPNTEARKELGFIGAHSDIGGGYAEGDLSDVALMWMLQQAHKVGMKYNEGYLTEEGFDQGSSPVLHDSVGVSPVRGFPFKPGREFRYLDGSAVAQLDWEGFGMDKRQSADYHDERYIVTCRSGRMPAYSCKEKDHGDARTLVGLIDHGVEYSAWLKRNYDLEVPILIDPEMLLDDGRPVPARP